MGRGKLFEAWSFRLAQPAPFDDPQYSGAKGVGLSRYNTAGSARKATLHAPTMRALLAYAKLVSACESGAYVEDLGAIGHQDSTYRIAEYCSASKRDCVVFTPNTGKFIVSQFPNGSDTPAPYSVGAGSGSGTALLFCLMPVLEEDDEFRTYFAHFRELMDAGWTEIKLSDYKRVIALVDTTVHGQFFMAASHFVTFDRNAIPADKVALWFRAPSKDDEEFVIGGDDTSFNLHDLKSMRISNEIANRGQDYYIENRVRYISIDEHRGYAIVQGTVPYEVEFEYYDGEIRHLTCNCFCSYNCKHEFAAMLQLRETLELIDKYYASEYSRSGYFAAVIKGTLFTYAINGKEHGSFSL